MATSVNTFSNFGNVTQKAGAQGLGLIGLSAGPAGLIATGAVGAVSAIVGVFAAHGKAVKTEADVLNYSLPTFINGMQMCFAQLNAGQISPDQASVAIDGLVSAFYSNVSSIIKKSGACSRDPNKEGGCGNHVDAKGLPAGLSSCNGPCTIGCNEVERIACLGKRLLSTGGTIQISPVGGPHAGFLSYQPFVLSYGNGGVGGVNWSQNSAGAPFNGQTPASLALAGSSVFSAPGSTTVVPYSQQATGQLQLNASPASIVKALTPKTTGGKLLAIAAVVIVGGLILRSV
jgi:hypothetical protein